MTMADRTTRRVYSAEQLHKLRGSFSAPKLREAIEEHDGEDAELVKGTVLQLSLRQSSAFSSAPAVRPSRHRLTATLPEVEPLAGNALGTARFTPHAHSLNHVPHPTFAQYQHTILPYCHCTPHSLFTMSRLPREPSFSIHKEWVLKLLETPSPKSKHARESPLTEDESPVHVLRESKSFAARSFRSRTHANSAAVASNKLNDENIAVFVDTTQDPPPPVTASTKPQVLGEIPNNGQAPRYGPWRHRTSPTPSIRKSKIEALVKHHGSPQHVRVTAGGRIVPSEQSPLCHPRFGYSAIKSNGTLIKVAPNHVGKTQQWISTTQDGYVAQDESGRLCQIVNGMILPLNEENGAVRLYVPAPNLNITHRGPSAGTPLAFQESAAHDIHPDDSRGELTAAALPTVAAQKNALELEYFKLEQELKDLDKTEVLHGSSMAKTAKDALFTKRRELVTGMDRVRKALKSLKELPQVAQVPTSPKAMRDRQSLSPQRDRLPPFLQRSRQANSVSAPSVQPPWQNHGHPVFGQLPPLQAGASFALPNAMASSAPFPTLPYQMPPSGAFMPPPPFDGTMGAPFSAYPGPTVTSAAATESQPVANGNKHTEHTIPQQDGSSSASDVKVSSPRQSRALPIRDPETKQITNMKSILNPMSPVYKPSGGIRQASGLPRESTAHQPFDTRGPTPLGFMHTSKPVTRAPSSTDNDRSASPAKKKVVVDSSSVSSVRTADFFPRNTRDYSMRKHEYPIPASDSEEKENVENYCDMNTSSQSPITPKRDLHNSNWNPDIPDGAFVKYTFPQTESCAAPTAPPGTPISGSHGDEQRHPTLKVGGAAWDDQLQYLNIAQMPDRVAHNLSPKNKRNYRFIEEHPSRYGSEDDSSSGPDHQCREELCTTASPYSTVDFADKSRDWIEGHQAGLYRKPVGFDRIGDFVDGYCAGLLKSQPVTTVSMGISDGSPAKPSSRRPTPGPTQSVLQQSDRITSGGLSARPPMELSLNSLDSLKQAVFAPQNENALMTPAADSSNAEEPIYRLGAWQKRHENNGDLATHKSTFPQRASSLAGHQYLQAQPASGRCDSVQGSITQKGAPSAQGDHHPQAPRAPTMIATQPRVVSGPAHPNERVNSTISIDSTIYRPWPGTGPRVISPFDWKTPSSVAHAANLATGYFAQSQYDGTAMDLDAHSDAMLTTGISGAPTTDANNTSASGWQHQHRNASLDGISGPTSPGIPAIASPNLSPTTSPRLLPTRNKKGADSPSKKHSPTKSPSPAKAKFEHIASKVGISVSSEKKDHHDASPTTKKRWKDIWHGSSKKTGSKDEENGGPASPAR